MVVHARLSPGRPVTFSKPACTKAWQVVHSAISFVSSVRPPSLRSTMW